MMGAVEVCRLQHMHSEYEPDLYWWEARKVTPGGEAVIRRIEYSVQELESKRPIDQVDRHRMQEKLSKNAYIHIVWGLRSNGWYVAETNERGIATIMKRGGQYPERDPVKLTTQFQDQVAIISIAGEIDAFSISPWGEYLEQTLKKDVTAVVINMEGVEFMGSGGLKIFYRTTKFVAKDANVKLVVVCPQPILLNIFRGVGLVLSLPVFESVDEALNSMENIEVVKMGVSYGWVDKRTYLERKIIEKRKPWWKFWGSPQKK